MKETSDGHPPHSSPNDSPSREMSQKHLPASKPQLQTEQSNGHSHHKHHSSSHLRHHHHHHHYLKHSGEHHHHAHRRADDSDGSESVQSGMPPPPPPENADGSDAPRELLVLSPTKILIRDPIKSTVKKKCVGHCGVQVNLKRRTESKEVQTLICNVSSSEQLVQKNTLPVEQTNLFGKFSSAPSSDQKKPRTDRDHPKAAVNGSSCSSLSKTLTSRPSQPSSGWKKDKSHASSSRHGQSDASHSSVPSASRMLVGSEPIPECVRLAHSRYRKYVRLEKYPNGGALVAHAYHHELQNLSEKEREEFADQFLELVYTETDGASHCVMGIVHDAAAPMEDFIDYFNSNHPNQAVKMGVLGKSDIVSTTMEKYREDMLKNYSHGTFRWGPLLQLSLVGIVSEEVKLLFTVCPFPFSAL